ncbi:MAG TPA: alpha/beta hydrolase [Dehalococcoidia bacterium]|nr:alpha/beta hydrolase [Dehalococcoidia bacterium]
MIDLSRSDPGVTHISKFIEVNGVRLHYLEWENDGPPLLILHGNSHSGGVFAPLAERLAPGFHVFSLDLRGHGLSQRPGIYTWAAFREDVTDFIDRLDLRELLLVAHSRGGGLALLTAAARSDRVRGVVAYEPTIPTYDSLRTRLPDLVQRTLNRRAVFASRDDMFQHFRHRGAFATWQDEFLRAYVEHGVIETEDGGVTLANPVEVEAQMYETMLDPTEWQGIKDCTVPVLTVYGERNERLREGNDPMLTLRRHFTNVRMQLQAGSTHSGPMEYPDLFATAIKDFASEISPPSPSVL